MQTRVDAAGENDYLKAIEMETQKVEPAGPVQVPDQGGGLAPGAGMRKAPTGEPVADQTQTMEGFELMLQEQYSGTAVIYRGLSARSRQEIFGQYLTGAKIPELRGKIMHRYLNR